MNVNDPRWASIDAFVEENRDNILRDITRLVAVPSVEGEAAPGAPFGPGPKAALAKALEIADELGLDTFNADSYIGWAETGRIADGQKFLGTHHLEKNLRQHLRIYQIKAAFQLVHLTNTSVLAVNIIASGPLQCKRSDAFLSDYPVLLRQARYFLAGFTPRRCR